MLIVIDWNYNTEEYEAIEVESWLYHAAVFNDLDTIEHNTVYVGY